MIHLKKQVASFLLARLYPEISDSTIDTAVGLCHSTREIRSSNATPAKQHVNNSCPSILTKGFVIRGGADEGVLISSSKYTSNSFSHFLANWFFNSSLFTTVFCCVAEFRRFLDNPRSSLFRQLSSPFLVPKLSTKSERYFSLTFSQGDNLSLVLLLPGVDSRSTLHLYPLSSFLHSEA